MKAQEWIILIVGAAVIYFLYRNQTQSNVNPNVNLNRPDFGIGIGGAIDQIFNEVWNGSPIYGVSSGAIDRTNEAIDNGSYDGFWTPTIGGDNPFVENPWQNTGWGLGDA